MSFQVTAGLFKLDFTDQHAILGVPLDADFAEIRKRYMKLARRLHSDTCPFESKADKDLASQFLSKFVTPAYNKFSKESDRKEYALLLDMVSKRAVKEQKNLQLQSDVAKQLAVAQDFQQAYKTALSEVAEKEYESIDKTLDWIGQLSELNLVYLLRKELKGAPVFQTQLAAKPTTSATPAAAAPAPSAAAPPAPPPAPVKAKESLVEQSYRRAASFLASKNYAKAILELKEALNREPKNSKCHALLAMCYCEQGQATMAKLQLKKALELNPQEPMALEVKKKLEQSTASASGKDKKGDKKGTAKAQPNAGKTGSGKAGAGGKTSSGNKTESKGSKSLFGGLFDDLFGGLFGGGKKKK